jgi:hypothetical protein
MANGMRKETYDLIDANIDSLDQNESQQKGTFLKGVNYSNGKHTELRPA